MSQSSVHTREQSEVPVWQLDEDVQSCFLCHKKFTLFFRRHHCRRCGKVVCAQCSTTSTVYEVGTYVVTPPSQVFMESPHVPHRTCDLCVEQLVTDGVAMDSAPPAPVNVPSNSGGNGNRAASVHGSNQIKDASQQRTLVVNETDDDDTEMDDESEINHCPICGFNLQTITSTEREQHIDECIANAAFSGSPTQFRSNRMLVYHIPFPDDSKKLVVSCSETSNSTLQQHSMSNVDEKFPGDDECVICLEELKPGEKVGRLECLCVFHYKCIRNWFKRKGPGECPVHAVHI